MKLRTFKLPIIAAMLGGWMALGLGAASAQDDARGGLYYFFDGERRVLVPAEEESAVQRRAPAMERIRRGHTPYVYEGKRGVLVNDNIVSSRVFSVHYYYDAVSPRLRAGHSLAPNVNRIVRRR